MTRISKVLASSVTAIMLMSGPLIAQDHHDPQDYHDGQDHHDAQDHHDDRDHHDSHHYVRHDEWRKGSRIPHQDWDRGERVDYHQYRLSAPPHGYEWREVDGNYVLAAVATGVIASVIVASAAAH